MEAPPNTLRYRSSDHSLVLRASAPEDAAQVLQCVEESQVEFRRFFSWAHLPQGLDQQRERLASDSVNFAQGGDLVYHLFEASSPRLLGSFGLHRRSLNPRALELGYWVRSSCAGQGLATSASKRLVVLCFEYLGCNRIQCGFNEANLGSARVNEKVGFRHEARVRFGEPQPTPELTAAGYGVEPFMIQSALFLDDRPSLSWYPEVKASLEVEF